MRSITTSLAIGGINFYQRHISPRKGYRCAYGVLHEQESCSQYAKQSVTTVGLWEAISLTFNRLHACRAAYAVLQQNQSNEGTDAEGEQGDTSANQCTKLKQGDTCANLCTLPCL